MPRRPGRRGGVSVPRENDGLMRVYLPADASALQALRDGEPLTLQPFVPESEDEQDEFEALSAAAEAGPVVIAADIENEFEPLAIDQVASFHVDVDGTGDLAWFATQELEQVLAHLSD
jgi:hypothetical protein